MAIKISARFFRSLDVLTLICFKFVIANEHFNYEFQWNKNISHIDYFLNLCPHVCYQEEKITLVNFERCSDIDCFPCDCQKPRCLVYGTCCPEVKSLPWNDGNSDSKTVDLSSLLLPREGELTNKLTKLTCSGYDERMYTFLLLRSCPDDYSDLRVRQWCEEDLFGQDLEYDKNLMDVLTKVSDPVTGVTYYNRYCAECNNATNVMPWKIKIDCFHYLYSYKALSLNDLVRLSLEHASTCQIKDVIQDFNSNYSTCGALNSWFYSVINQCNVTSQWTTYEPDIEKLCSQFTGQSFKVKKQNMYFANVFCAICNSEQYPSLENNCWSVTDNSSLSNDSESYQPGFVMIPPFTILLNFHQESRLAVLFKAAVVSCLRDEWSGPGNQCFQMKCADGKLLKRGKCVTALKEIRGLGYQTRLEYTFNKTEVSMQVSGVHYKMLSHLNNSLSEWFDRTLFEIFEELSFRFSMKSFGLSSESIDSSLDVQNEKYVIYPLLLTIDVYIISPKDILRDDVERTLAEKLFQNNITLLVGDTILTLEYYKNPQQEPNSLSCNETIDDCTNEIYIPGPFPTNEMWYSKHDFLWLNKLLTCPFVHFNKSRVHVEGFGFANASLKFVIKIDLEDAVFVFTEKDELKKLSLEEDGAVNICVDLLDSKLGELQEKLQAAEASKSFLSLYVITVICLAVSMLCLLITVVTYISFRTLRSVAGIHTMILSATLLLAQALLLTISHVQAPSIICTVLGVSTHFMWLCMFAWSFICCFHMYTIFTAKVRTTCNTSDSRKHLIVRVLCSLLLPAVIVSIVILVDYFTSDGQRMGYGTRTCYLNSKELILCSVAAPLGAVLLSNVFFFVSSVMEIYKVKKLQSTKMFKKSDRSNLYIYMKLSTMTGVFWLLALLAEGLDNNVLRYISVVMNGLQGMFIFMSYVCNKRVWTLYKEIWSLGQPLDRSEKGTLSQLASEVQVQRKEP
ncbi:Adhesion G protein-coupled receptor E3 [Biomphalaria glabrata]|nr:adhesion G protein-coupled receptor E2-like [Biomphalaria glabrata]